MLYTQWPCAFLYVILLYRPQPVAAAVQREEKTRLKVKRKAHCNEASSLFVECCIMTWEQGGGFLFQFAHLQNTERDKGATELLYRTGFYQIIEIITTSLVVPVTLYYTCATTVSTSTADDGRRIIQKYARKQKVTHGKERSRQNLCEYIRVHNSTGKIKRARRQPTAVEERENFRIRLYQTKHSYKRFHWHHMCVIGGVQLWLVHA